VGTEVMAASHDNAPARDGHFRTPNPMELVPFLGFGLIMEQNYAC